jgi:hypothetical protein
MSSLPASAGRSQETFSPASGEKVFLCLGTGSGAAGACPAYGGALRTNPSSRKEQLLVGRGAAPKRRPHARR